MYNLHILALVFSENSVNQVAEEKGISRAQCICTAIKSFKIILAPRKRGPGSGAEQKKEKTIEAMKQKDDEISFLRGHTAQLDQA